MASGDNRWWKRLQLRVWRRAEDDRDLADEVRFHLAEEERLHVEAGVPAAEARASARRDFGNVLRVDGNHQKRARLDVLEPASRTSRFAVRLLRRNRGFALFCVASLALGIGATGRSSRCSTRSCCGSSRCATGAARVASFGDGDGPATTTRPIRSSRDARHQPHARRSVRLDPFGAGQRLASRAARTSRKHLRQRRLLSVLGLRPRSAAC